LVGRPPRQVRERILNLTFHGIGPPPRALDPGEAKIWVETETFQSILEAARTRDDIAISFDDGNASDVRIALPALTEAGVSAMFFIVAGWLDAPGFVSRDDVARLVEAGMEVGVHGLTHRSWRELDGDDLTHELVEARRVLAELCGRPIRTAACPFGAYDRHVLALLRNAGYERVFTSDGGATVATAWLQPRNSVRRVDDASVIEQTLRRDRDRRARLVRYAKRTAKRWR
jgi:peptidoglycan/xylan/chitin deacetylase (PgdA/CDA1 family)